MGFSTHLGPWLLGTVKDTTGTVAASGQVRNVGASIVAQTKKVVYNGVAFGAAKVDALFTIPAGSQILQFNIDTLVAFTGSTAANMTLGTAASAALFWASTDITAQGRQANTNAATVLSNWVGAATTASPNGAGIGVSDITIQASVTPTIANVTLGTVQYTILYVVADSTGLQYPVAPYSPN
jgi:hypothetical protein